MPNYAARPPPQPAETPPSSRHFGITATSAQLSLCRYPDNDNNRAERALRTPVIGRKNFYGSGATGYLQACARNGGTAPAGAGLDPFLPWTPQGRARRRPASDSGPGP